MKFFVSYSRSLKTEVHAIINLLRAAGQEVSWDDDIPASADWWATICEYIERCEIMLLMVSRKWVESPYCRAELRYGIDLNHPFLPYIMDDHTLYTIPKEFGRRQWNIYDGSPANMLTKINSDCNQIQLKDYPEHTAPRPPAPNSNSGTLAKQFQEAVSWAEKGRFDEALEYFRSVSSLDNEEWGVECHRWIERLQRYAEITDLADHKSTLNRARSKQNALIADDPEAVEFDPLFVYPKLDVVFTPVVTHHAVVVPPSSPTHKSSNDLLPPPFIWIDIPGEIGKEWLDAPFAITKYPITNAQFREFIKADGYNQKKWWTDDGWEAHGQGWHYDEYIKEWKPSGNAWIKPRYWSNSWYEEADEPIVGVSWYEASAFCMWLSEVTSEKIILSTDDQWLYAAQGDDHRVYPWGNDWDANRCNNGFGKNSIGKTTPVAQYAGKGNSPFGVVDMVGNVWEWCLTDFDDRTNDVKSKASRRVLRGGSWLGVVTTLFRCDFRDGDLPHYRDYNIGFRVSRS